MYVSIKGFVRYALAAVLLIFTISSVNIVNTTIGNLHMRRKELAQLRVIGMSRKRLIKTVMLEGVMTTIVSNVIGFVIGIAFSFGLFYYLDMVISVSRSIRRCCIRTYHLRQHLSGTAGSSECSSRRPEGRRIGNQLFIKKYPAMKKQCMDMR